MNGQTGIFPAWVDFCERLKETGRIILRPEVPRSALDQAEGLRYLTRLLRAGLERSVEFANPDFPVFYALSHETIKIGSDNPDNHYRNAVISGARTYRLQGRLGSTRLLSFGTKADGLSGDGRIISTGEIDLSTMQLGDDGSFELTIAREPQPGNWLPMSADSSMLLVRETFGPREDRVSASMSIRCLDGPLRPPPLDADGFVAALGKTAAFVDVTSGLFADWMARFRNRRNDWTLVDQDEWQRIGGDPNIFYLWGFWDLAEDEALVIETTVPPCSYWNVQINNYWDESLDYRYFRIHHNHRTVRYKKDGSVRIVLAHRPTGAANMLETAGHRLGAFMWRWVGAAEHPIPRCTVVPLGEAV